MDVGPPEDAPLLARIPPGPDPRGTHPRRTALSGSGGDGAAVLPGAHPRDRNRRPEAAWTIVPAVILVVVGIAGFQALLATDTLPRDPDVIVEINAHQWYWSFNITHIRNGMWLNSTGNFKYLETTGALTLKAGLTVKI